MHKVFGLLVVSLFALTGCIVHHVHDRGMLPAPYTDGYDYYDHEHFDEYYYRYDRRGLYNHRWVFCSNNNMRGYRVGRTIYHCNNRPAPRVRPRYRRRVR